jgi:hypothetical protein
MKITIAYVNTVPGEDPTGKFELSGTLDELLGELNQQQFVRLSVRLPAEQPGVFERRTALVNRDDIAQIIEGWFE